MVEWSCMHLLTATVLLALGAPLALSLDAPDRTVDRQVRAPQPTLTSLFRKRALDPDSPTRAEDARFRAPGIAAHIPGSSRKATSQGRPQAEADPIAGYKLTDEVRKPIERPSDVIPCTVTLLNNQSFSSFPGIVPVRYAPPNPGKCGATWQLVVLSLSSHVAGRQFDRRLSFELGSVLLLTATTAEPTQKPGVKFGVERDLTAYSSFLHQPKLGNFELGNVVNERYTGTYYVTLELLFYRGPTPAGIPDLVLPVPNTGLRVPPNTVRAKLEVYISQYQTDEFYYANVPNSYYDGLTPEQKQEQVNGTSFREVVAYLDGNPVGAVFPQPLIYSGGIDPVFWAPFMGIGSLFCPTYSVDITPFVGKLLDGAPHNISFGVTFEPTGAFWMIGGGLLLWKDRFMRKTVGGVSSYQFSSLKFEETLYPYPNKADAGILVTAGRQYEFTGFVTTSAGNVTTQVTRVLTFDNSALFLREGLFQFWNIESKISSNFRVYINGGGTVEEAGEEASYPMQLVQELISLPDDSYTQYTRVSHSVLVNSTFFELPFEQLVNVQEVSSYRPSSSNFSQVTAASTQSYNFTRSDGAGYSRRVASSFNPYTGFAISYDEVIE